jgi:hypothetical protein
VRRLRPHIVAKKQLVCAITFLEYLDLKNCSVLRLQAVARLKSKAQSTSKQAQGTGVPAPPQPGTARKASELPADFFDTAKNKQPKTGKTSRKSGCFRSQWSSATLCYVFLVNPSVQALPLKHVPLPLLRNVSDQPPILVLTFTQVLLTCISEISERVFNRKNEVRGRYWVAVFTS